MKKYKLHGIALLALAWTVSAQAILIDNGDGTVTDTAAGLMWQKTTTTLPGGSGSTWNDATSWADTLGLAGYDDWRLPTALNDDGSLCLGTNCTDSEFGSLYYDTLGNSAGGLTNPGLFSFDLVDGSWFWTSTYAGTFSCFGCNIDVGYQFRFEVGEQRGYPDLSLYPNPNQPAFGYAWAVRDIALSTDVPEPQAWMLFGLGLGLMAVRRNSKIDRKTGALESTHEHNV